jgi:hypothetical protein
VDHNENWSRLFVVLKACVPDKNQASVAEALGKGNDAKRFEIALPSLNRAIHGTVGLGFGWAVHQFLM